MKLSRTVRRPFISMPDVDTLFEIGGQDAKYTHITAGVASDYSMNEACSAGTGSFLEESARETLGIDVREIAGIALRARRPPNFNDQCAAFIASDIKTAIHEGMARDDIMCRAGLLHLHELHQSGQGQSADGSPYLHAGRCLLQPGGTAWPWPPCWGHSHRRAALNRG
jgi:hypothetical protein